MRRRNNSSNWWIKSRHLQVFVGVGCVKVGTKLYLSGEDSQLERILLPRSPSKFIFGMCVCMFML